MAQHVEVAPSIVNNNPETMELTRRPLLTAAGWFFARQRSRTNAGSRRSDALGALFTFQTAHLVPAAHFCARGLHPCFTHPERGVGGAPRNVRVRAKHPWGAPYRGTPGA